MKQLNLFNDYDNQSHANDNDIDWSRNEYISRKNLHKVFKSLAYFVGGASGSQIADATKTIILNVRPALTYLKDLSLIEDSGRRVKNERGNNETVWTLTSQGKEALKW